MLALIVLTTTITALYIKILLLRIWMQCTQCSYYNPFAQFLIKITQPIVRPIRRIMPFIGVLDTASLLISYILSIFFAQLKLQLFIFNITFLYFGFIILIKAFGIIIFWLMIIRSFISWISLGLGINPVHSIIIQMTQPLISFIIRIIPVINGIDFSGLILLLILYMLNVLGIEYIPGWILF